MTTRAYRRCSELRERIAGLKAKTYVFHEESQREAVAREFAGDVMAYALALRELYDLEMDALQAEQVAEFPALRERIEAMRADRHARAEVFRADPDTPVPARRRWDGVQADFEGYGFPQDEDEWLDLEGHYLPLLAEAQGFACASCGEPLDRPRGSSRPQREFGLRTGREWGGVADLSVYTLFAQHPECAAPLEVVWATARSARPLIARAKASRAARALDIRLPWYWPPAPWHAPAGHASEEDLSLAALWMLGRVRPRPAAPAAGA